MVLYTCLVRIYYLLMKSSIQTVVTSLVLFSVAFPAFAMTNTNPPLINPATGFSYPTTNSSATHMSAVMKKKKKTGAAVKKTSAKGTKKVSKAVKTTKVAKVHKIKKKTGTPTPSPSH
jgi:anti-sigma28 factor (negative regulator of flagellin synthesis)